MPITHEKKVGMLKYKKIFGITLIISLVLVDQISKYIIRNTSGFYICNKGIAFGIQASDIMLFPILTLAICAISYFIYKKHSKNILYLLLILSGALSNIIDRLYFGCVIDFIDLKFWPVFNIADIYITIGAAVILMKKLNIKNQNDNVN